jgi:hypothetical protein
MRALATLLDVQYRAAGIHEATVTVTGAVAAGTPFHREGIAEHQLATAHPTVRSMGTRDRPLAKVAVWPAQTGCRTGKGNQHDYKSQQTH